MTASAGGTREDRVLVLLPSPKDAARTASVLAGAGVRAETCEDLPSLCVAAAAGAGAVLMTDQDLVTDTGGLLAAALRSQPPWSSLPLVVLTAPEGERLRPLLAGMPPAVTLIERPVRVRTLVSVLRAALRARYHQYDLRDALRESERQAAARAHSESRLGLAVAIAELGTFEINLQSDEVWVNERGREIYGWPAGEPLTFSRVQQSFHPDDREWVVRRVAAALGAAGPGHFELEQRIVRSDGAERWIRVRAAAAGGVGADGRYLRCVGTFLDITEARRTEQQLRESESRFRTLVEQVRDYAIFSTDVQGRSLTWNEGVERVLGYTEPEFRRLPAEALFTPEDRDAGVPEREQGQAAAAGAASNDGWLVRKDGARFWAVGMTTALRSAGGDLVGFTKVIRDQTEWKLAQDELARHRDHLDALVRERTEELERSSAQLRAAERMASLGTLAAGIGHDLGNLMLPIRERLDALLAGDLKEEQRGDVHAIAKAVQYLGGIVQGLRLLAQDPDRGTAGAPLELGDWWREAAAVLRSALPRDVRLHSAIASEPARVRIGRAELTQAVFNLVQNAGSALAGQTGGQVTVATRPEPGGARVRLSVEDNGPGMSEEVRRRCTEPFFTTKTRGMSTGLGLSLVQGIVSRAGATLEVHSELGRGSTFTMVLPTVADETDEDAGHAFVLVGDPRRAAFVAAALRALRLPVTAADGVPRARAGGVLVIEGAAATPEELVPFAEGGGRVVVLGEANGLREHPRITVLAEDAGVAALRKALHGAAAACWRARPHAPPTALQGPAFARTGAPPAQP